MRYDIFLSHCKEDKTGVAFPLYQKLEALGFTVWIDRNKIVPGDEIYESITKAIQNSVCVIAVIAPPYLERKWTQQELHLALEAEQQDKTNSTSHRILPIYHKVTPEQVNEVFPSLQNRAYERLETECFDPSDACGRVIIERIILWHFANHFLPCCEDPHRWLIQYLDRPHINQLYQLYKICNFTNWDLRSNLLTLTNLIRYLLAVLSVSDQSQAEIHHQNIALKYCREIGGCCFDMRQAITYDMLLSCKAILLVLWGDLKNLLDAG